MPAHIFDTWPSLVYRWIKEAGANVSESTVSGEIAEMKFDEMWHFIGNKKTNFELSRPLTVAHGTLWQGSLAIVILQRSDNAMLK